VDEPIHVLLLEGKPYWDAKFLLRTLISDSSIEVDSIVRLAEGRFLRRTLSRPGATKGTREGAGILASAPAADAPPQAVTGAPRIDAWKVLSGPAEVLAGPDGMRRYQVIVLGRDADVFLSEELVGRLREWIAKDGGALVCYRGAPEAQLSLPLARLLPVRWSRSRESRFHVQLTERGQELRWLPTSGVGLRGDLLARLPTLAHNQQPQEPKPLAVVLATSTAVAGAAGGPAPVITYQPYGSGRVVVIEGAGMWRWAFLPPQQGDQADIYASLWHSLIRWLASSSGLPPGQDMTLRAEKIAFQTNEPVTATLLMRQEVARPEVPKVELEGEAPNTPKVFTPVPTGDEPGTYRVLFGALPEGRYHARIARLNSPASTSAGEIAFDVRRSAAEQLDRSARPDLMARIAQQSGGAVLFTGSPGELVAQLQAARARSGTEQVLRYPAWDRWWLLLGIVMLWVSPWKIRRTAGLI
jgi:hypothetical protein